MSNNKGGTLKGVKKFFRLAHAGNVWSKCRERGKEFVPSTSHLRGLIGKETQNELLFPRPKNEMMPDEGLCKSSHQESPSENTLRHFYLKYECIEKACHTQVLPQPPTLENICDAWMCPALWRNPLIKIPNKHDSFLLLTSTRHHQLSWKKHCSGSQFPKLHSTVNWFVDEASDEEVGSLWWGQAPRLKARIQMKERKDHWPMMRVGMLLIT